MLTGDFCGSSRKHSCEGSILSLFGYYTQQSYTLCQLASVPYNREHMDPLQPQYAPEKKPVRGAGFLRELVTFVIIAVCIIYPFRKFVASLTLFLALQCPQPLKQATISSSTRFHIALMHQSATM